MTTSKWIRLAKYAQDRQIPLPDIARARRAPLSHDQTERAAADMRELVAGRMTFDEYVARLVRS
jgi:hypothetical protein